MTNASKDEIFFSAAHVKQRYGGVSDMWIKRRSDDPHHPFPAPTYFGHRRYWLLSELEKWELSAPRSVPNPTKIHRGRQAA
jgi:hypothetical protein